MVTGHRVNSNVVASGRNEERDVSSHRFFYLGKHRKVLGML